MRGQLEIRSPFDLQSFMHINGRDPKDLKHSLFIGIFLGYHCKSLAGKRLAKSFFNFEFVFTEKDWQK